MGIVIALLNKNFVVMPEKVKEEDVFSALEKTKPSPSNYLEKYVKWFDEFGSC